MKFYDLNDLDSIKNYCLNDTKRTFLVSVYIRKIKICNMLLKLQLKSSFKKVLNIDYKLKFSLYGISCFNKFMYDGNCSIPDNNYSIFIDKKKKLESMVNVI